MVILDCLKFPAQNIFLPIFLHATDLSQKNAILRDFSRFEQNTEKKCKRHQL